VDVDADEGKADIEGKTEEGDNNFDMDIGCLGVCGISKGGSSAKSGRDGADIGVNGCESTVDGDGEGVESGTDTD